MTIYADVQSLEPGEHVELFELDATAIGGDLLRFHGYTKVGPIYWQGETYSPWPIQSSGMDKLGDGQQPNPTLSVGDVNGTISAMCLYLDDLVDAVVRRHVTFGKYLDAANFPEGNPTANPAEEFPPDVWYVEQKQSDDGTTIEFMLSSPMALEDEQIPRRQIIANVCQWLRMGGYRGPYCGYTGESMFDRDDNPVTDPALDRCGGRLSSCKARFGEDQPLSFGAFPGADLLRS